MKEEHKVIAGALILGVLIGVVDGVIDYLFFNEDKSSVLDMLILDVPIFEIYIRSSVFVIILALGLIAARSITKRKRAEQALKKYAKDLEESNQLKDLFTDIMHHDVLNPAGVIRNTTEFLLDDAKGEERQMLEVISRNIGRQIEMVESASKLSKLGSVEDMEREDLDLKEIIDGVCEDFTPIIQAAGMELENRVTERMPIKANPVIEDIFLNFLSNAAKYAPEGKKVVIEASDDGESYKVGVKDYGEGIPNEFKEGIFSRFMRRGKEGVRGSGLGMAIAKRIVDLHGGKMWIEDNPEGGSIFYVSLPIAKGD